MTGVFYQSQDVVSSPLEDGAALLDLRSNMYFSLNAVGSIVWESIKSGATVDDIVAGVMDKYEISESQSRSDVVELLKALEAKGLARSENAPV